MAEAMAGETRQPFVNVDASMLNTMGMGVLKVKLLFRKLRKYALKYGGVVAFFDEADCARQPGQLAGTPGQGLAGEVRPRRSRTPQHVWRARVPLRRVAGARCSPRRPRPIPASTRSARRNRFFMGMGGMGGGGGGVLQALLTELSGLKKPRGFINRYLRRALGMRPKPPPTYRDR